MTMIAICFSVLSGKLAMANSYPIISWLKQQTALQLQQKSLPGKKNIKRKALIVVLLLAAKSRVVFLVSNNNTEIVTVYFARYSNGTDD